MEKTTQRMGDFAAGCAPRGGRGVRRQETVSARPGQSERTLLHASGDGPNAHCSASLKPAAENSAVPTPAPPRQQRPSGAGPAKEQQRLDPRITIRQKIVNEKLASINQYLESHWIQAYCQLKAEISDMRKDFMDDFSDCMKIATTEPQREHMRLQIARARDDLFSAMKACIRASCLDFGDWRSRHLEAQLEVSRTALQDDGNFDALVAVLENQVIQDRINFQKCTSECARAVWEEFVKELGLEEELLPA